MCGICGMACSDLRPVDQHTLARMTDSLRHRGPDSRGLYAGPGIGMGARRLSIIDVNGGNQPLFNEDHTLALICNGEIYNYLELRGGLERCGHRFNTKTDAETILHLYEDSGTDCVKRLRGMFAFALWDSRNRSLLLARDRLGIKPLYYHTSSAGVAFGSEIKAVLLSGAVESVMNPLALDDLMTFGFVRTPRTFVEDISALPPGYILQYRDCRASLSRYWEVTFPQRNEYGTIPENTWVESVRAKLGECVEMHLRSDVPVGAWLSGGIDSSAIARFAALRGGHPLETFSLEFDDAAFNEVGSVKTLDQFDRERMSGSHVQCSSADLESFPRAVWHLENISTSAVEIATMKLASHTAPRAKVILSGEGSDEIFGGYSWFRLERLLRNAAVLPAFLRRQLFANGIAARCWPGVARASLAPERMGIERYLSLMGAKMPEAGQGVFTEDVRSRIREISRTQEPERLPEAFPKWDPFVQLQFFELTVRMPSFIVHALDGASMASSVEARVPFLDHEMVELAALIPPAIKMRRLREKHVLREAMRNLLPREIVQRRKRGLSAPYQDWMRGPLPGAIEEMFSAAALQSKGYFDPQGVQDLLARHRSGRGNYGGQLFAVLIGQLWDELFFRGSMEAPA